MGNPLAGVNGDAWCTATPSITTSNEACTDSGDHITYKSSVHTFWDWAATFTVQCSPDGSASWVTVTDYIVKYSAGQIVFNTARVVGTNNHVRISVGSYFTATQLDATHKWALSLKGMIGKSTSFQAAGAWEGTTPTVKGGTGKIDTYRNDNRMFIELGNLLAFQLFVDKTNNIRWQFYATITDVQPASDAEKLQTQAISFTCNRDVYFLTT